MPPTFIQSVGTSSTRVNEFSAFSFFLPNPSLAGNAIAFGFSYADGAAGAPVISVADDQSNAWTPGPTVSSGTDHLVTYYCLNCAANTRKITVTAGTHNGAYGQLIGAVELYNVATSSAGDGSNSAAGTSATWSPGAFSTASANSIVLSFAKDIGGSGSMTFTPASGFSLLNVDDLYGAGSQYKVQVSAGSVDAAIVSSNFANYLACAFALKSASAGTAPSATDPRILRVQWVNLPPPTIAAQTAQFPCSGNARVIGWVGGSGATPTELAATDSKGNQHGHTPPTGSNFAGWAQFAYAENITAGLDTVVTLGTQTGSDATAVLYDLQLPGGRFVGSSSATGLQADGGTLTTVTHTPISRQVNGFVFVSVGINSGALRDLIGASYATDVPNFPEGDGGGTQLAEDNGWGHVLLTSLSALTFVFHNSRESSGVGNGVQDWGALALEFSVPDPRPYGQQIAFGVF